MPHPLHDILKRWLHHEQYAFDADSTVHDNYWPSERLPVIPENESGGEGGFGEPEPQN